MSASSGAVEQPRLRVSLSWRPVHGGKRQMTRRSCRAVMLPCCRARKGCQWRPALWSLPRAWAQQRMPFRLLASYFLRDANPSSLEYAGVRRR
jgi:hypothetical protein